MESWRMMEYRRSTFEVRMDVLAAIDRGPSRLTALQYATNTNWLSIHASIDCLLENELITQESIGKGKLRRPKSFKITSKGQRILALYKEARAGLGMGL